MGIRVLTAALVCCLLPAALAGQTQAGRGATPPPAPAAPAAGLQAEPDYVIGIGDVLAIGVWNEGAVSGDVVVRPDGKISVNLINEIQAAGLTAAQLRARLSEEFAKFFTAPTVMLQIKVINSRNVFIQGQVGKPGPYPLTQPLTISMLLAIAGGPTEYAKKDKIRVVRHSERGRDGAPVSFMFNYEDFENGKNLKQDIALKPGDVVIVPGG